MVTMYSRMFADMGAEITQPRALGPQLCDFIVLREMNQTRKEIHRRAGLTRFKPVRLFGDHLV